MSDFTSRANRALALLQAISSSGDEPVIVTDLTSQTRLSQDEAISAWKDLKEQGLIQTFNIHGSARINLKGRSHLEGAIKSAPQLFTSPTPAAASAVIRPIDLKKHEFTVALSFPGEVRGLVKSITSELDAQMGRHSYFYDFHYQAQLARVSLDLLLQDIYAKRSKLIVVFLSSAYQNKTWCGLEWRAIKSILLKRENDRVMLIRTDDGEVDGVFATDGYIDAASFTPQEIAGFINERASLVD